MQSQMLIDDSHDIFGWCLCDIRLLFRGGALSHTFTGTRRLLGSCRPTTCLWARSNGRKEQRNSPNEF